MGGDRKVRVLLLDARRTFGGKLVVPASATVARVSIPSALSRSHFLRPSATTESIELLRPAFSLRLSFALSSAFFLFSFLDLSFLPLSPISFSLVSNPLAGVISARSATV